MHKTLAEVWPKPKAFSLAGGAGAAVRVGELSAVVGFIFATSVDIEQTKANIAIFLLHGEPRAAMDMLHALRGGRAVALNAILRSKLSKPQVKLFERIVDGAEKFEEHRNRFAHWAWATCDVLPERICLLDPRVSAEISVKIMEAMQTPHAKGGKFPTFDEVLGDHPEKLRRSTFTYDLNELLLIGELGAKAYGLIVEFSGAVLKREGDRRDTAFAELEAQLQQAGW